MLLHMTGVDCNVNSNYTNYFVQLCGRIFTFCKSFTTNLHGVELVETINKGGIHFLIQRIVFLEGARKNSA